MAEKQTKKLTPETVDFDHLEKYTLTELAHLSDSGDSFIVRPDWMKKLDEYFTTVDISKWLAEEAEAHDASVQNWIAFFYQNGSGRVEQNIEKYLEWIKKSAEQGNDFAHCSLGQYYLNGSHGVEENIPKGKNLLEKVAESATALAIKAHALYSLGFYYAKVTKNYGLDEAEKAFHYFKLAAENGLPAACGTLGCCYLEEFGCKKDESEAFSCFK